MSIQIAEILRFGKAQILKYGWRQGPQPTSRVSDLTRIRGIQNGCCVVDATHYRGSPPAMEGMSYDRAAAVREKVHQYLVTAAREITPEYFDNKPYTVGSIAWPSMTYWNDDKDRTLIEVLKVYDRAIELAEAKV